MTITRKDLIKTRIYREWVSYTALLDYGGNLRVSNGKVTLEILNETLELGIVKDLEAIWSSWVSQDIINDILNLDKVIYKVIPVKDLEYDTTVFKLKVVGYDGDVKVKYRLNPLITREHNKMYFTPYRRRRHDNSNYKHYKLYKDTYYVKDLD